MAKLKPGPKPHKATEANKNLVAGHARVGTTQAVIADILNIDLKTLRRYYRAELDQSLATANATIAGKLFSKAMAGDGDTAALIFWLKTRAKWSEAKDEDSESKAEPLNVTFNVSSPVDEVKVTRGK